MLKIKSVEVINEGFLGLTIEGDEYLPSKDKSSEFTIDTIKRTRYTILPFEIRNSFKKLIYFYLQITGHWLSPFNKFLNDDGSFLIGIESEDEATNTYFMLKKLWDSVKIKKFKIQENAFTIIGSIETIKKKPISITTPKITIDDEDIEFYGDAIQVIEDICKDINEFLNSNVLPTSKDERDMLSTVGSDRVKETLDTLSNEDVHKLALEHMDKIGAIVMIPDAMPEMVTQAINEANQEEEEEQDELPDTEERDTKNEYPATEEESFRPEPETVNTFGDSASQGDFKKAGADVAPVESPDPDAEFSGDQSQDSEFND